MSNLQNMAMYEMWRQGLHRIAGRAEKCWDSGKEFKLDSSVTVSRMLRHLVEQCNRELHIQIR